MMSFPIKDAAILAEASYTPGAIHQPAIMHSCPHDDVQAHLLEGNILLLPGSNSFDDYKNFNLRPIRLGKRKLRMDDNKAEPGESGTVWHQGFLAYAAEIFHWLIQKGAAPSFVIGHSLGAAAAQILAKSYNVPAIGFAAPRTKFSRGPVKHHRQCLLINRRDDIVPRLPGSFFHMGQVKNLSPAVKRPLPAHAMRHYRAIVDEAQAAGTLPKKWAGG